MRGMTVLGRLLLFLLPMALVAAAGPGSLSTINPAYVVAVFLAMGRLSAFATRKRGLEETVIILESLPFAAFAAAWASSLGALECLSVTAAAGAGGAALASLEGLFFPKPRGFPLAASFCLLLLVLAWLASLAGPAAFGAAALVTAGLSRYAASRRGG
jgi:hypothetical protein